jgi:hypothetical protein
VMKFEMRMWSKWMGIVTLSMSILAMRRANNLYKSLYVTLL